MSRRPSPNVTPFIPPLSSPQPSPQPPLLSQPSQRNTGSGQHTPAVPTQYAYASTPYTPFVPSIGAMTPAMVPGNLQPSGYPPFATPHHPPIGMNGLAVDYTGYPQFLMPTPLPQSSQLPPQIPQYQPPPPASHGTPWSAPLQPPVGTPWTQPLHLSQYPPFAVIPPPPQHPMYNSMHMQGQMTPAVGYATFSPGLQPDPWGMAAMSAQLRHGWQPPPHAVHQPTSQGHDRRSNGFTGDRVDPFMSGSSYGPVLTPFLVGVVHPRLKLNPLITPLSDDDLEKPHLKWNMLYTSTYCQRSDDKPHVSWSKGRDSPATFPRVSSLRIVTETMSWTIEIIARDPGTGVTCGEVIDGISDSMYRMASGADFNTLPDQRKRMISEAYHYNRSVAADVPGGRLRQGMMRLDFLCRNSMFGGIEVNNAVVRKITGAVLPCVFVLKCLRRPLMTTAEAQEQRERARSRSRSSAATESRARSLNAESAAFTDSE
ncbi:hypothetical protein AX17_001863 [Amanita inopinata Kibby_2008]|nr:hypothetical protein AX17_001863 [Amanita inopinata Kibby_2008]